MIRGTTNRPRRLSPKAFAYNKRKLRIPGCRSGSERAELNLPNNTAPAAEAKPPPTTIPAWLAVRSNLPMAKALSQPNVDAPPPAPPPPGQRPNSDYMVIQINCGPPRLDRTPRGSQARTAKARTISRGADLDPGPDQMTVPPFEHRAAATCREMFQNVKVVHFSFFDGIGSATAALQMLGISPILTLSREHDEACMQVLALHFAPVHMGDVNEFDIQTVVSIVQRNVHDEDFHIVITFGPPCPDFSSLKTQPAGVDGSTGYLFQHLHRQH